MNRTDEMLGIDQRVFGMEREIAMENAMLFAERVFDAMRQRGVTGAQVTKTDDGQWKAIVRLEYTVDGGAPGYCTGVDIDRGPLQAVLGAHEKAQKIMAELTRGTR